MSEPLSYETEAIAGDRQALTAEQQRPKPRWLIGLITLAVVIGLIAAVGYIARAQIQNMFKTRLQAHNNPASDDTARPKGTRIFSEEPGMKAAAANDAAKATLPGALLATTNPVVPAPASTATGPGDPAQPIPLANNQTTPRSGTPGYSAGAGQPVAPIPQPSMLVDAVGGDNQNPAPPRAVEPQGGERPAQTLGFAAQPAGLQSSLTPSQTPGTHAKKLAPRNVLLARGGYVPCVLETQLVSNIAGFASCIVTDNIYSDDGRTVLIERGAHVTGEYKSDAHNGDTRLFVLWNRIRTKNGITIDLDSPGGDSVGGMGLPGYVDNHWWDRIGAAFLLSAFQDAVTIAIARQNSSSSGSGSGTTVNTTPSNTASTSQDLAKEVLRSTINIPPTIYKNRGELVTIYVARDLWFDTVYQVR